MNILLRNEGVSTQKSKSEFLAIPKQEKSLSILRKHKSVFVRDIVEIDYPDEVVKAALQASRNSSSNFAAFQEQIEKQKELERQLKGRKVSIINSVIMRNNLSASDTAEKSPSVEKIQKKSSNSLSKLQKKVLESPRKNKEQLQSLKSLYQDIKEKKLRLEAKAFKISEEEK